jgi:hypothetical protein
MPMILRLIMTGKSGGTTQAQGDECLGVDETGLMHQIKA